MFCEIITQQVAFHFRPILFDIKSGLSVRTSLSFEKYWLPLSATFSDFANYFQFQLFRPRAGKFTFWWESSIIGYLISNFSFLALNMWRLQSLNFNYWMWIYSPRNQRSRSFSPVQGFARWVFHVFSTLTWISFIWLCTKLQRGWGK